MGPRFYRAVLPSRVERKFPETTGGLLGFLSLKSMVDGPVKFDPPGAV